MASEGPRSAGTGASTGSGTAWANPTRVVASDDSRAQASSIPTGNQSQNRDASQFGFSAMGNTDTIDGIVVEIEKSAGAANRLKDFQVQLLIAGSASGTDKKDTTNFWPTTAGEAYTTYGASNDAWGLTLTGADVKASNFGVTIRADNVSAFSTSALLDHIRITVYYTPAGGGPTLRQLMMTGVGK